MFHSINDTAVTYVFTLDNLLFLLLPCVRFKTFLFIIAQYYLMYIWVVIYLQIQTVVDALIEKRTARVVVLIIYAEIAFKVIQSTPLKRNFIWIAPDAWSEEMIIMKDLGTLLLGSVLVVTHSSPVLGYSEYFKTLNPVSYS